MPVKKTSTKENPKQTPKASGTNLDFEAKLGPGHKIHREQADTSITVEIADLIVADYLTPGQTLYSRPGQYGGFFGKVLSDGRIEVAGQVFNSPSSAAIFVRKKPTNGWHFWRLDPSGHRRLEEVRAEYLRAVSPEKAEEVEGFNSAEVN